MIGVGGSRGYVVDGCRGYVLLDIAKLNLTQPRLVELELFLSLAIRCIDSPDELKHNRKHYFVAV